MFDDHIASKKHQKKKLRKDTFGTWFCQACDLKLSSQKEWVGDSLLVNNLLSVFKMNVSPLSPNSVENGISLYIITTCSTIQLTRIKEVITKDK